MNNCKSFFVEIQAPKLYLGQHGQFDLDSYSIAEVTWSDFNEWFSSVRLHYLVQDPIKVFYMSIAAITCSNFCSLVL